MIAYDDITMMSLLRFVVFPVLKDDPTTSEIFLVFQELKETEVFLQVHFH